MYAYSDSGKTYMQYLLKAERLLNVNILHSRHIIVSSDKDFKMVNVYYIERYTYNGVFL